MRMRWILLMIFCASTGLNANAKHPKHHHRHAKHLMGIFAPSRESQLKQNRAAELLGMPRIKNDKELRNLIATGELSPVVSTQALAIDPKLPSNRRYCRPATLSVLTEVSQAYFVRFQERLVLTSAVRTEKVQMWLLRFNRNAAPVHGETASAHMYGNTVDIARKGMTREQNRFMEKLLTPYVEEGIVIVEEEAGQQWCYHIAVFPVGTVPQ